MLHMMYPWGLGDSVEVKHRAYSIDYTMVADKQKWITQ